ncbi:MAG TPA: DNA recombination protein RmuC [Gammaproteobacteria bacterium]|nr:DNA recombination protein RmuC [Gammaproteobacteria bacterium]
MNFEPALLPIAGAAALVGLLIGLLAGVLALQRRVGRLRTEIAIRDAQAKSQAALEAEREAALALAGERMAHTFESLAGRSMESNSATFLRIAQEHLGQYQERARGELGAREQAIENLVKPIREALARTEQQISQIEKERQHAFGGITAQLQHMAAGQQALQSETRHLVNALRRPEVRGRWGEITLRRVVELAGMVEYCDFYEQEHTVTADGASRPDMIIRMPERRELVVDVKTPLDAYLTAIEAVTDDERAVALARHARNMRDRVTALSGKSYWSQFSQSPEFVILFVPGEQFLAAALDQDPKLQEDAFQKKVILTTPATLVGLLKVVVYGWRQLALADNADRICDLATELYKRLSTFTEHLSLVGRRLGGSVEAYNQAVGSLERQVLPGARKFTEMGIHPRKAIASLDPLDKAVRRPLPGTEEDD